MPRYLVSMSFNGSKLHGWQSQHNANTVQQETERCFRNILKEQIAMTGCGRTDTGVHARFYVAHFDTNKPIENSELPNIINQLNYCLPKDINIHEIIALAEPIHARFDAVKRTYKYFIARTKSPFFSEFSYHYHGSLDIELMNKASEILMQHVDFSSFVKSGSDNTNNNCLIYEAYLEDLFSGQILVFTITANRFLRNMVRAITGTLVDVGREKISLSEFSEIISQKNRSLAGMSIDAKGLFLWDVIYKQNYFTCIPVFPFQT